MLRFILNLFKKGKDCKEEEEEWTSEKGSELSDIDDNFERLLGLNREGLYGHRKERYNQRRG